MAFYKKFKKKYQKKYKKSGHVTKAVRKYVKKAVTRKMEPKVVTSSSTITIAHVGVAPQLQQLTSVSIGTGDGQRIGDEIFPKSMELFVSATNAAASREANVRYIMFRWKQVSTATPSPGPTDICGGVANALTHDNRGVIDILCDRIHHMSDTGNRGFLDHVKIPLKYKRIDFQAASSTLGLNNVYLWVCSDDTANDTTINLSWQMQFCDA